jgi:hypothetical protein
MSIYDNPYSKYRFTNTRQVEFRVDPYAQKANVSGVELRSFKDHIKTQLEDVPQTWLNNGATWIVDNVYKCNQITTFDQPITSRIKLTLFKLFKL